MSLDARFMELFRETKSRDLDAFHHANDVIGQKVSVHLAKGEDASALNTLKDMRALLRAAYCQALANDLPVRSIVQSAKYWQQAVEAYAVLRAASATADASCCDVPPMRSQTNIQPSSVWNQFNDSKYWRLDGDYGDDNEDVIAAHVAMMSSKEAESVLGKPSALKIDVGKLRKERVRLRLQYGLEVAPPTKATTQAALATATPHAGVNELLLELVQLMGYSERDGRELIGDVIGGASLRLQPGPYTRDMIVTVFHEAMLRSLPWMTLADIALSEMERGHVTSTTQIVASRISSLAHRLLTSRDKRARLIITMRLIEGEDIETIVEKICVSADTVVQIVTNFELEIELAQAKLSELLPVAHPQTPAIGTAGT
jgi:hypothetical protein